MKTMFIRESINMILDHDTQDVSYINSSRECIQRIYVAPEDMHVICAHGDTKEEADVKKDDIIVTFYTNDFEKRMVIVKSEMWLNNIKNYEKKVQAEKEEWAAKKLDDMCTQGCESC